MAKIVNVHRIDDETFYLVRLTPQEIAPLLPDGLDSEKLPEGQVFITRAMMDEIRLLEAMRDRKEIERDRERLGVPKVGAQRPLSASMRVDAEPWPDDGDADPRWVKVTSPGAPSTLEGPALFSGDWNTDAKAKPDGGVLCGVPGRTQTVEERRAEIREEESERDNWRP